MNIIPINNWVLLKTVFKKNKSKILNPLSFKNPNKGIVVSFDKNIKKLNKDLVVFFNKKKVQKFEFNKKKYFFVNYKDIVAFLKNNEI